MRWWGSAGTGLDDQSDYAFKIVPYLTGGNPQGLDAASSRPAVSPRVASRIIAHLVRRAIDLNRQSGRLAEEVEYEGAQRMLASEVQTLRT